MIFYKPEWIKWRHHNNSKVSKALVYQLLEGTNFLFEDTSADLVKFLLDVDPWTSIDLKSIHNKFDSLDGEIINIFLEDFGYFDK